MIPALVALLFAAASASDSSAVFDAFSHADGALSHFAELQRTGVSGELDLVIAMGSPTAMPDLSEPWVGWTRERKIGLLFQEKARRERVYLLGIKAGFEDCAARIERATDTDVVISCTGEKFSRHPNQKWVYDVRAKGLVEQFSYQPYAMQGGFRNGVGAVFVGSDQQQEVVVEYPAFRILTGAEARHWTDRIKAERPSLPAVVPALPVTTYDEFAAARPGRVKDGYGRSGTELRQDSIGPWQREDGRIWFGKNFYDGEGTTGVGGFGFFDMADRTLHLFAPPEIADWSVSAIDVEQDAVWMTLVNNGEYGGSSGGLLRYDRATGAVRRFALPDIGVGIVKAGEKVLIATDFGIAVVEGDQVKRYFVDRTTDGRLRVAAATR